MFERFTEGSRRAIFFARYEAGRYGSPYIETEHLLLGVLREGPLRKWFPNKGNIEPEIRAEIEKRITHRDRISTSAEIPLSNECKTVLNLAGETCKKLGHGKIELEHLLIAIFRVEESLGARVLLAHSFEPAALQEQLAKTMDQRREVESINEVSRTLNSFLSGVKSFCSEELLGYFGANAELVDATGKRWDHEEIANEFETVFAFFSKRNASYAIERTLARTSDSFIAIVLWKNALLASEERTWMCRMSVLFVSDGGDWKIQFLQITPVLPPLR